TNTMFLKTFNFKIMKKLTLLTLCTCIVINLSAQAGKTDLYDLIRKLLPDSTGNDNLGDWSIGLPGKFPIKWKVDKLEMSQDTSINFYRVGNTEITIKGHSYQQAGKPVKWSVMLKGPRSGYSSFSIISTPTSEIQPKYTIESIFGNKPFSEKLLKSCDTKTISGYYYYELKLPKKDTVYLKLSWISINGNGAIRIDCFDKGSEYAVKLDCIP
ncbi:MAG: hypothetical protein ABIS01_02880, partial [Ferruginibacter sp.]